MSFVVALCGPELKSTTVDTMVLLLRRVTSVAAKRTAVVSMFNFAGSSGSVRGFAAKNDKKKKKSKKGGEDTNFEQMLRAIKGQYPDAYVGARVLFDISIIAAIH